MPPPLNQPPQTAHILARPNGAKIAYVHAGSGDKAMVFIHGALCDHQDWRHQIQLFSAGYRVFAPDLQGHGQSSSLRGFIGVEAYAQDIAALCREHALKKVWLIAHSMGCRVALRASELLGDTVAGLVLVDGAYLTPRLLGDCPPAERAALAQDARDRASALYVQVTPAERAQRGFAEMFFDRRMDAERDRVVARAQALPSHVARELMPDFAAWDVLHMEPTLAAVKVPLLAFLCTYMDSTHHRVQLQADTVTPWIEALRTYLPRARLVRYPDTGHFPMLERPEEVNADILDFMRDHP